ncbi:MAG: hypothetical protein L3J17_02555 [Candidatus Jettenia sp.]|nr:MAG: hypothetical protein L3J17_02555 [Candidatus Jettenia sp.]
MNDNNKQKEQEEIEIRKVLDNYATHSPYRLNPDTKIVDRVVKGLAMRKMKYGYAYCPCRLVMGDAEKDKKIICPCVYHVEEIARDEECHCNLFVSARYQIKDT